MKKITHCRVCNGTEFKTGYKGKIRSGGVNSDFIDGFTILQCNKCDFTFIDQIPTDLSEFYESEKYRSQFDYQFDVKSMQKKYDHEQTFRIEKIGCENIRGKTLIDIGAGPGLFADAASSLAAEIIVVEPAKHYHNYYHDRGYQAFSYAEEVLAANIKADMVISNDTIEHVDNPSQFIKTTYELLKPDGIFYLSMPNNLDIVRLLFPKEYEPFFYQVAHLNYFCKKSVEILFRTHWKGTFEIGFMHKYPNLENLLNWAHLGIPGTLKTKNVFDSHFKSLYKNEIERLGIASHLFIKATKS